MTLPLIGAALGAAHLDRWLPWILEKQRDLELQNFITAETLEGDWRPEAERVRGLLAGYTGRLGIHGPFWGLSLASPDRDIRALVQRRMMQGLDVCEAINATQMVIHSPFNIWGSQNNAMRYGVMDHIYGNVHATMDAVVKRAEDQGVTLVLENIEDLVPAERRALVDSFASEAFKLSIDTGHAQYMHSSHNAPPVDYFVRDAGRQLDHVHLQDTDGYSDRHWALGEGKIAWEEVFRSLALIDAKPKLVLEMANPDHGIPASMKYLVERGLTQ